MKPVFDQEGVEARMNEHVRTASAFERMRDAAPYESKAYWRAHDCAMRAHYRAEQYMPKSGRTIDYATFFDA